MSNELKVLRNLRASRLLQILMEECERAGVDPIPIIVEELQSLGWTITKETETIDQETDDLGESQVSK